MKSLGDNIQELANISERQPSALPIRDWGSRNHRHQDPTFEPPLSDIESYAQKLHTALQRVWTCPLHDVHHVNLRLDQRLRSRNTSGRRTTCELASFTLAIAPSADADTWHGTEVCVSERIQLNASPHSRSAGVRFSVGSNATQAGAATGPQEQCVQDLCTLASDESTETRLHLNDSDQIVRRSQIDRPVSVQAHSRQRISFRSLLHQPRDPHLSHPLLTTEQAIELGCVVVSTFLQLYATRWLAGSWCSGDLYFFKSGDTVSIDKSYVSMTYGPTPATLTDSMNAIQDDGQFFVRMGVMLLEIWAQTSIEELRPGGHATVDASTPNSLWQDLSIIREYLKRSRDTMQPCFLKAMKYCMHAFATGLADTRDAGTRIQVVKEVLLPFEQELENWRT